MKTETTAKDLSLFDNMLRLNEAIKNQKKILMEIVDNLSALPKNFQDLMDQKIVEIATNNKFKKLPIERRNEALSNHTFAIQLGTATAHYGDHYSGNTYFTVVFAQEAAAFTNTTPGDNYSRSCKYSKTDATHIVRLDPLGIVVLRNNEALRKQSAAEGLPLIALYEDNSAVWVKSKNKKIVSEKGWIAFDENHNLCYHSIVSYEDAKKHLKTKVAIREREKILEKHSIKNERRARLIVRLCGNKVATIRDAKNLGFCDEGISSFQSKFNVGDEASLPTLIKTGNSEAIYLAMSIARKVSRKVCLTNA